MCTAFFTAAMSSALGVMPPMSSCAQSSSRPARLFSGHGRVDAVDATLDEHGHREAGRSSVGFSLYSRDLPFGMVIHCQSLVRMRARMMICPQWLAMCESERVIAA